MIFVHVLLFPHQSLVRVLQIVKSASARQANQILGRTGQKFWLDESCDHWVRGGDEAERTVRYIESSPVRLWQTTDLPRNGENKTACFCFRME